MVIRFAAPEDFRVDEIPLYAPAGEGDHTFVRVEKRDRTTEQVARDLALAAAVAPRDVGYAGRKDRVAVATQWFSVPRLAPERALALELPGARILQATPHPHKLRTGHLRGNRFRMLIRHVEPATAREATRRLERMLRVGMPNRFGRQRFGRQGDNAELGRRLLAGELELRDRRRGRFLISALQAAVFNVVLAEREDALDRLECGDIAVIHASGALFRVEDPEREMPRARELEISATGPIFGTRVLEPTGAVARRERAALEAMGIQADGLRPPRGIRLRGSRRALRVRPVGASAEPAAGNLHVTCELPPGSYATVLAEALIAPRPG